MEPKTITLHDVRNALMLAMVRRSLMRCNPAGEPVARYAAYTKAPSLFPITCRSRSAAYTSEHIPGPKTGPMTHGDLGRIVRNVHMTHGATEVRKTWGAGMRAMQAEIGVGAMR